MQLPERQEQAVVLVPRRGYSTFLSCRSCGEVVMCPHCDVSLTVHRNSRGIAGCAAIGVITARRSATAAAIAAPRPSNPLALAPSG